VVNSKAIGGIVGGIVIIGIIIALSNSNDDAETSNLPENDSAIAISDSATVEKNIVDAENNPNYSVDEDGVKRYTISAIDTPDLGD
jgi:hypothetical protein